MNPKRLLLILAGLLAFTVGFVTALHAQDEPPGSATLPGEMVHHSLRPCHELALPPFGSKIR
jgi:hypothetical protein